MAHWIRQHAWCELNYGWLALSVCGCTCKDTVGVSNNETMFDSFDPNEPYETNCHSGAAVGECPNICDQICSEYDHWDYGEAPDVGVSSLPPQHLGKRRPGTGPYIPGRKRKGEGRPDYLGLPTTKAEEQTQTANGQKEHKITLKANTRNNYTMNRRN